MRHAEKKNARGKSSCGAHTRGKQAAGSVTTKLANARLPDWIREPKALFATQEEFLQGLGTKNIGEKTQNPAFQSTQGLNVAQSTALSSSTQISTKQNDPPDSDPTNMQTNWFCKQLVAI